MINENNNVLNDKYIVKILKLTEKKINELVDENVVYSGKRNYFSVGKIKGKNIGFVFSYTKKTSELGFYAESVQVNGTLLLKNSFEKNKNLIEEEVGLKISLDKGIKNKNWYRLITKIFLDESRYVIQQIDELVRAFVRFKTILTTLVNNDGIAKVENYEIREMHGVLDYDTEIAISENQWKEMLLDNSIFTEKDINLILLIYAMGGKATAKELSVIDNGHPTSYNSWVVSLSKRILSNLKINLPIRNNGKAIYCCIPFVVRALLDNNFQWILRDNLYSALEQLIVENKLDINSAKNKYKIKINIKEVKAI